MMEGLTQIVTQVANNNKRDEASKQMMKNIKIFDGSNKAECITWLSQVEAAAKFTNTPFQELICHGTHNVTCVTVLGYLPLPAWSLSDGRQAQQGLDTDVMTFHNWLSVLQMVAPRAAI